MVTFPTMTFSELRMLACDKLSLMAWGRRKECTCQGGSSCGWLAAAVLVIVPIVTSSWLLVEFAGSDNTYVFV